MTYFNMEDALRLFNKHGFDASELIIEQATKAGVDPVEIFVSLLFNKSVIVRQLAADYFAFSFHPKTHQDFERAVEAAEFIIRRFNESDDDVATKYLDALVHIAEIFYAPLQEGFFSEEQRKIVLDVCEKIILTLARQMMGGSKPSIQEKAKKSLFMLNLNNKPDYSQFISAWAISGDASKIFTAVVCLHQIHTNFDFLSEEALFCLVASYHCYSTSGPLNFSARLELDTVLRDILSSMPNSRAIIQLATGPANQEDLPKIRAAGKKLIAFLEKRDGSHLELEILKQKLAHGYGDIVAGLNQEKEIVTLCAGTLSKGIPKPPSKSQFRVGQRRVYA